MSEIPVDESTLQADEYEDQDEVELEDGEVDDGVEMEEEVEVEVTDDEDGNDTPATPPKSAAPQQKASQAKKPAQAPGSSSTPNKKQPAPAGKPTTPGKVTPGTEVKNVGMESPQMVKKTPGSTLSPDKTPFPAFSSWNITTISQIEIAFPILTGKNETTNELTRSTRPKVRYWKAQISFKYANLTSETMRFDNVHILLHTGKEYGSGYEYICLPGSVSKAFSEAGKTRAPTKVDTPSLVPDLQRWWKIANNVQESFSVINHDTKKFHKKSLETIFDVAQSGISCSVTSDSTARLPLPRWRLCAQQRHVQWQWKW